MCAKLYEDDKKDSHFHIYFNAYRQSLEREQLEQKIDKFKTFLEKHIGTDARFSDVYHEYFTLIYNKKNVLISVQEKADVIERELKLCGYFCIITSDEMTASEALIQYKGRDISEKLFSSDKTAA